MFVICFVNILMFASAARSAKMAGNGSEIRCGHRGANPEINIATATPTRLRLRSPTKSTTPLNEAGAVCKSFGTTFVFFNTNLKYSLADNFDDLIFPPEDTFPAQVRSDVKQYLKNINEGILIGRAEIDYYITPFL